MRYPRNRKDSLRQNIGDVKIQETNHFVYGRWC